MLTSILLPLDGSPVGEDALPTAMMLAQELHATLQLVHVHQPIMQVYANDLVVGEIPTVNTALDAQCRADETDYLAQLAGQLHAAGIAVETHLLTGVIDQALATAAVELHTDLIVMSTHARRGLNRMLLGDLASVLIRHSNTPVLLVHVQPDSIPDLPVPPFRSILVALDGSPLSEQVFPITQALGAPLHAEYTLLHVVAPHESGSQRSAAQQYLDASAKQFADADGTVQTALIFHDDPAEAIADYAHEHNIDLIVVSTHGRGGLSQLLFGSVSNAVVQEADRAVMVYRPQAHPA